MKQTEMNFKDSFNISWSNCFYNFENSDELSNTVKGVYVFYDEYGRCLRVGQSGSVRQRILSYFRLENAYWIAQIDSISVYFVEDEEKRLMLEEVLRLELNPAHNTNQSFKAQKYLYKTFTKQVNQTLNLEF
ncbi:MULTISPECIES: hypothetical protein [Priestia]|uniref:hypothetical protein n=1 Tax=Priestia TaxID=2800373 RepID=UPI001C8E41FC|nr:hypothetical protein [Priestia aryabhattai]MBY0210632.1 hypothetical protein [Priestia aryabhattai]